MELLMIWTSFSPPVSFSLIITAILYFFASAFNQRVTTGTQHWPAPSFQKWLWPQSHSRPLALVLSRRWQRQGMLPRQHPCEALPQTPAWEAHLESPGQRCRHEADQGVARQAKARHHRDPGRVDFLRHSKHCRTPPAAGTLFNFKGTMELGRRDSRRPTGTTTNAPVLTGCQQVFLNTHVLEGYYINLWLISKDLKKLTLPKIPSIFSLPSQRSEFT